MYQIDNRDWKTWPLHGLSTLAFGQAIGWLTPLDSKTGTKIMVFFYFSREFVGLLQGNKKYVDMLGDSFTPLVFYKLRF